MTAETLHRLTPNIDELRQLLDYDPDTGWFTYKGRTERIGWVAPDRKYRYIEVMGLSLRENRVAFALMTGRWPVEVDHENRNKADNRWCNLRECSHSQNISNIPRTQRSGFRGVYPRPNGRWYAAVTVNQKTIYLGMFDDPYEAHIVYCEKAKEFFGEFSLPPQPNMSEFW